LEIPHFIGLPLSGNSTDSRYKMPNSLKMAFVGRVALQKNLLFAIDVVRRLAFESELHVFGAADPDYLAKCRAEMAKGTGRCRIILHGHVMQQDLLSILPGHDVLLHPTLGENFGYSIIECLAMGIPVLLSDKSPWLDVGEEGAGWVHSLTEPDSFAARLGEIYTMGAEWDRPRQAALNYTRQKFDDRRTAEIRRRLYSGSFSRTDD
jgi:glycosyltransferase involved in cell wall biosynthesis